MNNVGHDRDGDVFPIHIPLSFSAPSGGVGQFRLPNVRQMSEDCNPVLTPVRKVLLITVRFENSERL